MTVLSPGWLAALLAVGILGYRFRRQGQKATPTALWLGVSIVFVILALARPVLPQQPVVSEQTGSDVILVVDLSYSMRAQDVAPSRLEAAKTVLRDLVRRDNRDRFGVIGFTTNAIVLSPLTKDAELLEHLFGGLDESQIMTKGTRVMGALELARKMSYAKEPLVIVMSDGGDEASYAKEADFIRENGLRVNVVMLASGEGATIPTADGILKDDQGHIVVTARNDAIGQLAAAGDGKVIYGADAEAIQELLDAQNRQDFRAGSTILRYRELFYVPLVLALAAFMLAFTRFGGTVFRAVPIFAVLAGVSAQGGMFDFAALYLARQNYIGGNFERSADLYGRIDSPQARYNRANALYKEGKYEAALGVYRTVSSDDAAFKSKLYYNMGNCYIRLQEFRKAKEALLKSLTLRYTKEADENLRAIADAQEQDFMLTGRQKGKKRAEEQGASSSEHQGSKEGGSSNMPSDMASGGGGDDGKKVQSDPRLSMSQGKAQLSSRQYELINQRSVHETKPW